MIFSQAQKQGMLMLIGFVLAGYGLTLFFNKKNLPIPQKVIPLLLETPKIQHEKMAHSKSLKSSTEPFYQKRKKPYTKSKSAYKNKPKPVIAIINLNLADSTELDAIPGIGAKTALRILKYKNLIGQFVAVEQLRMVYGISEENYLRMAPFFKVERVGDLAKKDLNAEKTYKIAWIIGKEKAAKLTERRKALGWFKNWDQLNQGDLFTSLEMSWLKAYFEIPPENKP